MAARTSLMKSLMEERLFGVFGSLLQLAFLILFIVFSDYENSTNSSTPLLNLFVTQMFMVLGFGLIYSFLRKNIFNGLGFNLILIAFGLQWALFVNGFMFSPSNALHFSNIHVKSACYAVITVLITHGAVLGKVTPAQLLIILLIEIPVYALNKYIGSNILLVTDPGEGIYMHLFGALFGVVVSRIIFRTEVLESRHEEASSTSDFVSSVGTLILWLSWSAFHASSVVDGTSGGHVSIVNTLLALVGSTACSFITGNLLSSNQDKGRFQPVYFQYSLFAGAVSVASVHNHLIRPWGAILMGMIGGIGAVFGHRYLTKILRRIGFHDTRGVLSVHGLPGILSALASAVTASMATQEDYKNQGMTFETIFPGMAGATRRNGSTQAGYHIAVLVITIAMSMASGAITGFLLRFLPGFTFTVHGEAVTAHPHHYYNDRMFWILPQSNSPTADDRHHTLRSQDPEMQSKRESEEAVPRDVDGNAYSFENIAMDQQ